MLLIGFIKKELIQMLRDVVMVFALLFMPLVQSFLFSYAINNEPRNITIGIDSTPNDYMLNRIYEHALASGWFVKPTPFTRDPFSAVQSGHCDVVLVALPRGLTRALYRGDSAELQVLIDASNVLKAQSVSGYIQSICANVIIEELSKHTVIPSKNVEFATRILFNPELDTKIFIVPSVMVMIVAISVLSLICISIAKEKETGTMETLISSPICKRDLILGKTLPCFVISFFNMLTICLLGFFFFNVPFRGNVFAFLLSFFVFCASLSALAIFLSTFCRNQQQAMLAIMMVTFIMMMLSGAMFPVETMPSILKFFANTNPLTHFIFLSRNIMLKGCNMAYLLAHIWPMLAFGIFFGFIGIHRFKQTL